MERFKRNQLEEAIIQTLHAERRANALKLRIKRLLVTDRRLGRKKGSRDKTGDRFAFHGQDPPGSGVEIMFSGYEAFAVCAGLILLEHGIPQGAVVSILREIRSDLELAHRETLKKDPGILFDAGVVRALAKPGMIATDNSAPVFIVLIQVAELVGGNNVRALVSVCHGFEAWTAFVKQHAMPGFGTTTFEFVSLMHRLAANLSKTRPIKRGRAAV
jgi:hypothetical protein